MCHAFGAFVAHTLQCSIARTAAIMVASESPSGRHASVLRWRAISEMREDAGFIVWENVDSARKFAVIRSFWVYICSSSGCF